MFEESQEGGQHWCCGHSPWLRGHLLYKRGFEDPLAICTENLRCRQGRLAAQWEM